MKSKYILTFTVVEICESKDDAIQKGFNMAKNERKLNDNQCRLEQVERIDGLISVNIEIDRTKDV